MSGDIREKLAVALEIKVAPRCYIQRVFDQYKRSMSGKQLITPLSETVHLRDENFPYWIKLQKHNPKTNTWHRAKPEAVLPDLHAGTFDERGYRLEDPRRARVLTHLPNLLQFPDWIYENKRSKRISGKYIYIQEHEGQLKVAFTLFSVQFGCVIVVSSFWTTKNWLKASVEEPPLYTKKKATL